MGEKRLLELKARRPGLRTEAVWCETHANHVADVRQKDTYFQVGRGRLKLRRVEGEDTGTLIYYRREDRADPKRSRVSLVSVVDPAALRATLRKALGVLVEVRKRRRIYRRGQVQIHLDEVDDQGTFLEFERFIESDRDEEKAQAEFAELRETLGVREEDLIEGSYSDLVLERGFDSQRG
ncbi:MAG: class IV adenylate cyclase [Thermoplasmata archaeon]